MSSSKPTNYNKLRITDLDTLLTSRGLPITGTKLQKAARLFKEDADTSAEQKASEQRAAAAFMPNNRAGYADLGRGRGISTVVKRERGGGEIQENTQPQSQTGLNGVPELGIGAFPILGEQQTEWMSVTASKMREGDKDEKDKENPKEVRDRQNERLEETSLKLHAYRGQDGGKQGTSCHNPNRAITVTPSTKSSTESANEACGSAYNKAAEKMKKDREGGKVKRAMVMMYVNQKVEEIAAWIGDQEWSFVCVVAVTLMVLMMALLCAQVSRFWKDG
jgi:hypothetical protein